MANAVSIPVRLQIEDLRGTISQIQNSLKGIKVDSSAYAKLNKELENAASKLLTLEAQTSKAFTSQNQFSRAEREITSIEEALQRTKIQLQGIRFKDLKLTDAEAAPLKEIEKQIDAIQAKMKSFAAEQLKTFKGTDVESLFKSQKGRGFENETFANVFKEITRQAEEAQRAVTKTKQELEGLTQKKQKQDATVDILNAAKKSQGATLQSVFGEDVASQFFKTNGTYKNNGKQAFVEYLRANYTLSESVIQEIKETNAKGILDILKGIKNVDPYKTAADKTGSDISQKNATLTSQETKNTITQAAYQQMAAAQQTITQHNESMRSSVEALNIKEKEHEEQILANRQAMYGSSEAYNALRTQMDQMRYTLDSCNAEFIRQQQVMNTFNSIKTAITNFMGFTQVLNLVKRAVNEAASHIKELDNVMTEIAVVTDFSQSDLWGQIDTYSSMAQQYGVAIEGVYEVSALYYQMGLSTDEVMARNTETLKMAKIASLDYATAADYMTVAMNGFKMEAEEACRVTDVYSAVAAATASDTEELATAMSKTAASLEAVGVSFEGGTAMIATIEEATRESATNIGSALKSIASRLLYKNTIGA